MGERNVRGGLVSYSVWGLQHRSPCCQAVEASARSLLSAVIFPDRHRLWVKHTCSVLSQTGTCPDIPILFLLSHVTPPCVVDLRSKFLY
jgi:hypothetical protein